MNLSIATVIYYIKVLSIGDSKHYKNNNSNAEVILYSMLNCILYKGYCVTKIIIECCELTYESRAIVEKI